MNNDFAEFISYVEAVIFVCFILGLIAGIYAKNKKIKIISSIILGVVLIPPAIVYLLSLIAKK